MSNYQTNGKTYVIGLSREYPTRPKAHLYDGDHSEPGLPMCRYGWNRDQGSSYSIWRGNYGTKGICEICKKRANKGLTGIESLKDENL